MDKDGLHLGLDIGSVSAKTVLIDEDMNVVEEHYTRTKGQPLETVLRVLTEILTRVPSERIQSVSVTGTAAKLIAELLGAEFVNEVIAQAKSTSHFHPEVKTVIEMGGEDSKLLLIDTTPGNGDYRIQDFSMNTICAAGTGSFLDQQANRLHYTIEEFSQLALKSKTPPRIAGRCSVFAKSDMIHLQQGATPDYDIVAGLCYALARNYKSNIAKGKNMVTPVSFQGGVAANLGMRKAFFDVLELKEGEFIIPKHFASMGAIGAAFLTMENPAKRKKFEGVERLRDYVSRPVTSDKTLEPLSLSEHHKKESQWEPLRGTPDGKKIPAYLGIDVGSISTNVVVTDENIKVLSKRYLMTAGRPIEAIRQGLKEVGDEVGHLVEIKGVCTTGSGRYLTGDYVGADVIRNEITAQATAAAFIDPEVDTIFEIGGQDSKYISLEHGAIVDFEMNKACAAGTGSFLEEQAEKIGISIKEEFGNLALGCKCPVSLGERCTVFMESDLVHYQQKGAKRDDLVAGLSYSIVLNYLNKVVGDKRVGNRIFFQGGTAFNKGVVAAFEKVTGKKIIVPEHNEVTGAIGCCILARDENKSGKTNFKGWDLSNRPYELTSFECKECPNRCEIRRVTIQGEKPLFYGSRCEKYDVDRTRKRRDDLPDLFKEREEALMASYVEEKPVPEDAPVIGIPRMLNFLETMPFWKTFFTALGFRLVFSDTTNKRLIAKGVEKIVAETCFPIKVAHGHLLDLMDKGVDTIFLPSIITMPLSHPSLDRSFACPYVQAFPYSVKSAIDFKARGVKVLSPVIHLGAERKTLEQSLVSMGKELGKDGDEILRAIDKAEAAQRSFFASMKRRGREVLQNLKEGEKAMVIVSRPYNGCDPGVNLGLPSKLRDLGVIAIPMDCLPLDEMDMLDDWKDMYWKYGQKIFSAAHIIRDDPRLYAIYITNFACGPDSFILHFFKEKMRGKPYLQIEVDEHSADVGAITRLEAFLDSLKNIRRDLQVEERKPKTIVVTHDANHRKVYIPYMAEGAHAIVGAFQACGIDAEVTPKSNQETIYWGRKYTSGKECYPCILTTGDMVRVVKSPDFDRKKVAFFMPSGNGPCRFGQYHRLHRLILDDLGYPDVPIYSPTQDENLYKDLHMMGKNFTRLGWQGMVAVDLLEKKLRETRPYEVHAGDSDRVFQAYLKKAYEAVRDSQDNPDFCMEGLVQALQDARKEFDALEIVNKGSKPRIGIVGEIYIRSNEFSNEFIVRSLEELGGEVWLPPISEWFLYLNFTSRRYSMQNRRYGNFWKTYITELVQKRDEHKMDHIFDGNLVNHPEPSIKETLAAAKPYLDDSFEGEAVLSIGKCDDYLKKGCSGLVNVMPFTCMPGTIVGAVMKRYREDHNTIPFLNMAYDGQEETNTLTRLEAFMHQARQYQRQYSNK
ncbi:MAG TPA: acyl-CoA dehydratase activase [Thermodesulfobacteriota bacterium]|nr:acyl-CoA dehydratase activase [Thermodesulfobacteriota bacterium]